MSDRLKTIIWVILLVTLIASYVTLKPDRFEPLGGQVVPVPAQIDGEQKTVSAVLAWEQSGFQIYGLWLFPTRGRPVLYCEEHQLKWTPKDEYRTQIEAEFGEGPPVPRWRYFLGIFAVAYVALAVFLLGRLDGLIVDRKVWRAAKREDTFGSYKNYLLEKHKPKFFGKQARRAMMAKVGGYRTYYAFLTSKSEGEQRDALLRILDHIARTGDLNVGVSFEFENALRERSEMIDGTPASFPVVPVRPCFATKHNASREKLLTLLLDRVFSRIFPERILVLEFGAKMPTEIRIGYRVSNTSALYRRESDKQLPLDKQVGYTGIQFEWDITLALQSKTLLHRSLQSRPASTFTTVSKDPAGIYKAMAMSAFVDMGKSLLLEFGLGASIETPAQPGDVNRLKKELYEQFVEIAGSAAEGLAEQIDAEEARAFFEQHSADIGAMMSGLSLDLDNMMNLYIKGIAEGIDVGEMTFDAIAGLLGD